MEGAHRHAKVVEQGTFVIIHVGAHGWWWGAGRHFLIMVVGACGGVGRAHCCACGRSWRVVALPCKGGGAGCAHQWWWGAGHHLSWWGAGRRLLIVVVVGTCGWHWVVVAIG